MIFEAVVGAAVLSFSGAVYLGAKGGYAEYLKWSEKREYDAAKILLESAQGIQNLQRRYDAPSSPPRKEGALSTDWKTVKICRSSWYKTNQFGDREPTAQYLLLFQTRVLSGGKEERRVEYECSNPSPGREYNNTKQWAAAEAWRHGGTLRP